MPLSPRQARFYAYSVDIWRQADVPPAGADFGKYSLLAATVQCLYVSSREDDRPSPIGRTKAIEEFVMDRFDFELAVDLRDTDILQLVTGPNGTPDIGRWFAVHGNPQRHAWRAGRQRVLAKGCPQTGGSAVNGPENAAYSALVTLVGATWPTVTAVTRSEQLGRTNWETLLANGALVPPFVVIALGRSEPEGWGLDNSVFRVRANVILVVSIADSGADLPGGGTDATAYLLQQLAALRAAVIGYAGEDFQLAGEQPAISVAATGETNRLLLNLLAGLQAGELNCGLLVGTGP